MMNNAQNTLQSMGPTIAILPPLPSAPASSSGSTTNNGASGNGNGTPVGTSSSVMSLSAAAPSTPHSTTTTTNNTAPFSPQQHHQQTTPKTNNPSQLPDPNLSSPRLSSTWDPDTQSNRCSACHSSFDQLFKRRHHCRLCGRLFCHDCSNTRSLIPPSALVLKSNGSGGSSVGGPSFSSANDGDASVTYVGSVTTTTSGSNLTGNSGGDDDTLLYGKGLERRMLLARHPQRTCHACRDQLAPLQEELCLRNSNAMRYNYIDEGNELRRLCNSPLAFTLGHEVRKAAYALGNLLPGNKGKRGGFVPTTNYSNNNNNHYSSAIQYSYPPPEADPCHVPDTVATCKAIDPTLKNIDGMHIPAKLLRRARGVAIVTSCKGGLGFAGFEFGTGLVVARRRHHDNDSGAEGEYLDDWSAPSAIGIAGFAWGALLGAQVSDHVFLLMTEDAVRLFASEKGRSIQLGADIGVAVGPLGRSAEADIGATSGLSRPLDGSYASGGGGIAMAPIYTYSLSKGLYAGVSLDGRILMTRDRVNEKFYGRRVSAHELLSGQVATPPAAQPLYDALKRCRIYGGGREDGGGMLRTSSSADSDSGVYAEGAMRPSSGGSSIGGGGLMERLSHATGAGLPVSSTNRSRYSSGPNPYNLSGRENPGENLTPGYD